MDGILRWRNWHTWDNTTVTSRPILEAVWSHRGSREGTGRQRFYLHRYTRSDRRLASKTPRADHTAGPSSAMDSTRDGRGLPG
jgi:hypothetical protein